MLHIAASLLLGRNFSAHSNGERSATRCRPGGVIITVWLSSSCAKRATSLYDTSLQAVQDSVDAEYLFEGVGTFCNRH